MRTLTAEEKNVILNKGTEYPFTGKYDKFYENGIYFCKQCDEPLFSSDSKFNSGSGWPSFDDSIKDKVSEVLDKDGMRIEIICSNCKAHLGHIFKGENITNKNARFCVNSISLIHK